MHHWNARSHDPTVDGARVSSNSSPVAPARSIDPITVSAFAPPFPPSRASRSRSSSSSASPSRWANAAAGSSPADGTRFDSSRLADTRVRS
ncbi:MAG TPA: hypothetical protein VNG13_12755 [Mycobacteriales bacterium]|nr:hypothetical protein [Mycobacteriales bacterium]